MNRICSVRTVLAPWFVNLGSVVIECNYMNGRTTNFVQARLGIFEFGVLQSFSSHFISEKFSSVYSS